MGKNHERKERRRDLWIKKNLKVLNILKKRPLSSRRIK